MSYFTGQMKEVETKKQNMTSSLFAFALVYCTYDSVIFLYDQAFTYSSLRTN